MKPALVAVAALVAAAAGLLAGMALFRDVEAPRQVEEWKKQYETAKAQRDAEVGEISSRLSKTQQALDAANSGLAKAREEAMAARAEAEEAKAAKEAAVAAASPAAAGGAAKASRAAAFSFGEYDAFLSEVDWKSVGASTKAMTPLLEALWNSTRKKEPPDLEQIGKIQQHNGALIQAAQKIAGKLPGSGINGAFTHPAFMSNVIAATLEAAGLPLSEAQARSLGALGREYSDRDRARIQAYDDRALGLQKVLDEADLRDRFFEAAFALLTPEQRQALTPAAVKGLVSLDLFSSGLMLAQHLGPVPAADRKRFADQVVELAVTRLGAPAERRADVQRIVDDWAAGLPESWFTEETMLLVGVQPTFTTALVLDAGRREVALIQRLAQEVAGSEEQAKKLRATEGILVPLVRREPAAGEGEGK